MDSLAQNIFLSVLLHKRRRSGGYVEAWGIVLSGRDGGGAEADRYAVTSKREIGFGRYDVMLDPWTERR
ncbi:MAG: hypothetical protein K2N73_07825 [Lachnospiraceae bacterium]|nr:hypothetical protein [Lachnospiraceae bacterium]